MSAFLLLPGAGGAAWFWHRVVPGLHSAGHTAIAVELPGADPASGLPEYVDLVSDAAEGQGEVVLVAQSMGAFTALCTYGRLAVRRLVLVNAMIPAPGETADIAFSQPCDFARWPDVPTTVLAGRDDRFFPLAFQRRLARERLGAEPRELPGGHLNALSQPDAVTEALLRLA